MSTILVLAHDQQNHYGLLIIDLEECVVTVTDGLKKCASTWSFHLTNIFKKYNLLPMTGCINDIVELDQWYNSNNDNKVDNKKFIMKHNEDIVHQDLFSCGPTACVEAVNYLADSLVINPKSEVTIQRIRVVELYLEQLDIGKENKDLGLIKNKSEKSPDSSLIIDVDDEYSIVDHSNTTINAACIICFFNCTSKCKTITLDCCQQVIHTYCGAMWSTLSNKCANCNMLIPINNSKIEKQQNDMSKLMTGTQNYSTQLQNDPKLVILRGQQQTALLRAKQHVVKSKSRKHMNDRFNESLNKNLRVLQLGDVVRITINKNERHRGRSDPLTGIIYQFTEGKLPYVVSEHGVVDSLNNQPKSLPFNRFELMPNQDLPLSDKLYDYRSQVLEPNYKHGDHTNKFFHRTETGGKLMIKCLPLKTLH